MFWRSLPGLKRIVRPGGIRTSLPVRGLRPMPRLRGFTWKTPNPRSSIRSPRCMEVRIASNTASTATSALTLVMSAIFDTSLTMSKIADITKVKAEVAVGAVFDAMRTSMQRGERIELRGFGVFQVKPRKRGIGRNPRTGKEVRIPPGRTIRFKPGKDLQNIG